MTAAISNKAVTGTIIDVAIKNLIPSPHNVRKSTPSKESDLELVAGIRARGLISLPSVHATDTKNVYAVIAGKRRLKALQALVKEGHFKDSDKISCRLVDDDTSLEEISLMENAMREKMHPADEFEAIRKMQKSGSTPEAIALHLGITEKLVNQRLRLGQVAPAIIKAYRNNEINLDAVMAFTVEDDKQRQVEVYEQLKKARQLWARHIRETLKGDTHSSTGRLGKFVGRKAYEAAGGSITSDLFEDTVYFNDGALLSELALAKLQRAADKLSKEWNWLDITLEEKDSSRPPKTIRPFDTQETAKLREQLKVVQDNIETLHQSVEEEDWTEKHDEQADRLNEKEEELQEAIDASQAYRPQEMQFAGCRVGIGYAGKLDITLGIIRKEDEKKLEEAQGPNSSKKKSAADPAATSDGLEGDIDYSQALTADLTTYRLNIAKHYLSRDSAAVQTLLVYTLCCKTFEDFYYDSAVKVSIEQTNPESSLAQPDTSQAFASFKQRRDELSLDWLNNKDDGERFEAFNALPCQDKLDLMAYCVARAFTINSIGNPVNQVAEIVIRGLDIPWHREFKPTAENYFNRLSKPQLIEHGKLFLDEDWPARAAKRSKKELANDLEEAFAGKDQTMPADKRAAAADWVPPGFLAEVG